MASGTSLAHQPAELPLKLGGRRLMVGRISGSIRATIFVGNLKSGDRGAAPRVALLCMRNLERYREFQLVDFTAEAEIMHATVRHDIEAASLGALISADWPTVGTGAKIANDHAD